MFEFRWTALRHVGAASENVAKMPQKISFMQVVRDAVGRFPKYLGNKDFPINRIFLRGKNTISRRAEKEIEGLAVPGCKKWPSA